MRYREFMDYIKIRFNFQIYGLDEGFNQFEKRACGALNEVVKAAFEWRDENKNDVTIYVTIKNEPVEFEEGEAVRYETFYYAYDSQY